MAKRDVSIALCNDEKYEAGLHVTLWSLLTKLGDGERTVRIYFFFKGFADDDIARLHATLRSTGRPYQLIAQECDTNLFRSFPGLHGNYLTYVRLVAPQLIRDEKIIFLDSDVIVNTDIAGLFDSELGDKCLGVVANGSVKHTNDQELLKSLGMAPDTPYFNAAVLVIDTAKWKERRYTEQCLAFLHEHRRAKLTVDQTALNYVLRDDYRRLPDQFNISVYPSNSPMEITGREGIFHFCGSPKPWDAFGRRLHGNYALFESFLNQTQAKLVGIRHFKPAHMLRTAWLARSYWKNSRLRSR